MPQVPDQEFWETLPAEVQNALVDTQSFLVDNTIGPEFFREHFAEAKLVEVVRMCENYANGTAVDTHRWSEDQAKPILSKMWNSCHISDARWTGLPIPQYALVYFFSSFLNQLEDITPAEQTLLDFARVVRTAYSPDARTRVIQVMSA